MSTVIKVENLSKQYCLGQVGSGTIRDDLHRFWARVLGKEDPTLKISQTNILTPDSQLPTPDSQLPIVTLRSPEPVEGHLEAPVSQLPTPDSRLPTPDSNYVWALKDINFSVQQGEVLGIIGKNGAGKSTLLKILSKVTAPTKGSVSVKGRIASLLEVGTGFHNELSGRENIFLNGAILGMSKAEIRRKCDEIINFSGVEQYIDTPVKRYSSGMLVRLAFAVAAHLEPEILIIDEVLAVGDAEFQKKCLGKMKDVSGQGRTVLFVSHNMAAIKSLCKNGILLKEGQINCMGKADEIVDGYLKQNAGNINKSVSFERREDAIGNENIRIKNISILPDDITIEHEITLNFEFWNTSGGNKLKIAFDLVNINEQIVFGSLTDIIVGNDCTGKALCYIPANLLNDDTYSIHLFFFTDSMQPLYLKKEIVSFEVKDICRNYAYYGKVNGVIRPLLKWSLNEYVE